MNTNIERSNASNLSGVSNYTLDDFLKVIFSNTNINEWFDCAWFDPCWNETALWLYDSNCENYEKVLKIVKNKTPYNKRFTLPQDQVESYFHSFLVEHFIKNNQLKPELDKGKKVKASVVYEWFLQYVVRTKFKEGKDALQRTSGARTQSEVMKIKAYQTQETDTPYSPSHHIKNLEDAETGTQIGEPDYYIHEDAYLSVEEQSENEHMKRLLLNRFGADKVDMYYSLWLEIRYADYTNKKVWAAARKVKYKVLTTQIEQVVNLFKSNQADFGY
jgi:hypothetical protein